MKIEINIPQLAGLPDAINNLADALLFQSGGIPAPTETKTPQVVQGGTIGETPAAREKREISEQIVSLGGTPPAKGSVAKYRETLSQLQAPEEAPEEAPVKNAFDRRPDKGEPKTTLENTRSFAAVFMKSDPSTNRKKFKEMLVQVGAANITEATEEQRAKIIDLLVGETGMTLLDALKKADA